METTEPIKETETPKAELKVVEKPKSIALDENMALAPINHQEFKSVITAIAEGGGFPTRFKTFPAKIAAANLATSLMGKKWQLAINNIADIKGTLSIFGELPGAIAEQTGQIEMKRVSILDSDYKEICTANKNLHMKPFAGVCKIKRKGRPENEFTYTIDEATAGGFYPAMKAEYVNNQKTGKQIPNEDSPWMKHTKVMLMRKAMNLAVKFEFPDAIVGVPIAEYDFHTAPDLDGSRDVTPGKSIADEMNEEFGNDGTVPSVPEAQGA
jgi:hypothetical protein